MVLLDSGFLVSITSPGINRRWSLNIHYCTLVSPIFRLAFYCEACDEGISSVPSPLGGVQVVVSLSSRCTNAVCSKSSGTSLPLGFALVIVILDRIVGSHRSQSGCHTDSAGPCESIIVGSTLVSSSAFASLPGVRWRRWI